MTPCKLLRRSMLAMAPMRRCWKKSAGAAAVRVNVLTSMDGMLSKLGDAIEVKKRESGDGFQGEGRAPGSSEPRPDVHRVLSRISRAVASASRTPETI